MRSLKSISLSGRCLTQLFFLFFLTQCSDKDDRTDHFELLTAEQTGLTFANSLQQGKEINIMNYMYFFNGGGVGIGDFNNDGLPDIFFSGNLNQKKLWAPLKTSTCHTGLVPVSASEWLEWDSGTRAGMTFSFIGGF